MIGFKNHPKFIDSERLYRVCGCVCKVGQYLQVVRYNFRFTFKFILNINFHNFNKIFMPLFR